MSASKKVLVVDKPSLSASMRKLAMALSIIDVACVRPADKYDKAWAEANEVHARTGKRKAQWKTERNKR